MGMSSSAELVHWLSSQGTIRGSKSKEKLMKTGIKLPRYGFQVCIALPNYLKCLKAVWVYSARFSSFLVPAKWIRKKLESPDAPKNPRAILRERAVELRKAGQHTTRQIFDELSPS
jgi:hypothetical protein